MKTTAARVIPFLALITPFLVACTDEYGQQKSPVAGRSERIMLGIIGFNYTNHYIAQFYVNGTGGGNVWVSSPTGSGGGTTCCAGYRPGTPLPIKIHVRWTAGGCTYITREESDDPYVKPKDAENILYFYKEAEVMVNGPIPADPRNMEIHFYPDGHVEAAITAEYSENRLKLPTDREINGYPACTPEQRPAWAKR